MINDCIFLKLSGKFLDQERNLRNILELIMKYAKIRNYCIYLIIGGGKGVDDLRLKFQHEKKEDLLIQDAYHWNAIRKLDENLERIFNILKIIQAENTDYAHITINFIEEIPENNYIKTGIYLVKSFGLLKTNDNLQHSWAVTSDSIAIYISHLFNLNSTILVKDISYLEYKDNKFARIDSAYLQEIMDNSGYSKNIDKHLGKGTDFPIDPYSPQLIKKLDHKVLFINGIDLKKFEDFLNYYIVMEEFEFPQYGTLIVP